jgi:glycosyltransferase involved in cell wall biosynthesis
MQILIYEPSSFGGCFEYSKEILAAYQNHPEVEDCTLVIPKNACIKNLGAKSVLITDKLRFNSRILRKLHFLYRNFINPFILFFLLLKKKDKTVVLFNDFEQISAPLWAGMFRLFFSGKHIFAVILHDPDRDGYPPSKALSTFCMRRMMSLMDFAFYHGYLPDKPYYTSNPNTRYIDIPHGIYELPDADPVLSEKLSKMKTDGAYFLSILGNIRDQKNYSLTISTLPFLPKAFLIIAGAPSHSGVDVERYKETAKKLGVENRVIWIEKFLSEHEIASVIDCSDTIMLNYAKDFTSQSGIFNLIAPFKKQMIISKGKSSLCYTAEKFQLGTLVEPDDHNSLIFSIKTHIEDRKQHNVNWDAYLGYASWKNLVDLTLTAFNKK